MSWKPICAKCFGEHNDGTDGIEWDGEVYWTYCRECNFWTEHTAEAVESEHQEDLEGPQAEGGAAPHVG